MREKASSEAGRGYPLVSDGPGGPAGSAAARTFDTQAKAIEYGRAAAKSPRTELYIHGRDGTIKNRDSYKSDPSPLKNKK